MPRLSACAGNKPGELLCDFFFFLSNIFFSVSGNNDISPFQATGKKCTVTGYGYMGESKSTLIFPRMLYLFARERITDNFTDESIIDCIVLF